jgi:hypothetical protein
MGPLTEGGYPGGVPGVEDFDSYVDAYGIPEKDYPAAFALWIAERTVARCRCSRRSRGRSRRTGL